MYFPWSSLIAKIDSTTTIVPFFEIDVLSVVELYAANAIEHDASYKPDPTSIKELQQARDALNRNLAISQRVKASTLEDVNLDSPAEPRIVKIAWSKTWPLETNRP